MSFTFCTHCGARHDWSWTEAFDKFGFDDGDGIVMTQVVAQKLRLAGCDVTVTSWGLHNDVITQLTRDGASLIPEGTTIGYDEPRDYLPDDIVDLLDRAFPEKREVEP